MKALLYKSYSLATTLLGCANFAKADSISNFCLATLASLSMKHAKAKLLPYMSYSRT